jgi:hypothetical protein
LEANQPKLRFFHPAMVPKAPLSVPSQHPAAVDRLLRTYLDFKLQHGFPIEFDRDDVELLGRYMAVAEKANGPTWRALERGGYVGASWFLHELVECLTLLERNVNIFDEAERQRRYWYAHAHGLIVEHEFLFDKARQMKYTVKELGSLIRFNPTVSPDQAEVDLKMAQIVDRSLRADPTDEDTVKQFFQAIQ